MFDHIKVTERHREEKPIVERKDIESPVLRRIIKEVEEEKRGAVPGDPANVRNYNRIHNRHNRGR